jgi:cytochrome c peroxidase
MQITQLDIVIILLLLTTSIGCKKQQVDSNEYDQLTNIPTGFPDIVYPDDNQFSLEKWDLGKQLFFDPRLSIDNSISCGSCHKQDLSFADQSDVSLGVSNRLGTRNTPSLANVAYHPYYTREGGVPTLEMQVLVPIQEHNEFDFNIIEIVKKLEKDPYYSQQSQKAYGRAFDHFVITRALACFERTLISGNSKFDKYFYQDSEFTLTASEIRGMDLFFSDEIGCSNCHGDYNFTNYEFENNGLYLEFEDEGRFRLTGESEDIGKFKVPSLRNVSVTAPYMHNGSLSSLDEVIEHYIAGGQPHPNKSSLITSLVLSPKDKSDLIAFLHTLTDHEFLTNTLFAK